MPIFMFAVVGTIISSFLTGITVYYSTKYSSTAPTFPFLESLQFGVLISSIDPIAILSVLSSLNITDKDTLYILVFGESLLNDGIVITLFKSLMNVSTESLDSGFVLNVIADFAINCFFPMAVALVFGAMCLTYFWLLRENLNYAMEVASFFIWALIPYYICDALELSGIIALVTIGFFMDIYIGIDDVNEAMFSNQPNTIELINFPQESELTNNDISAIDHDAFSTLYISADDIQNIENVPPKRNIIAQNNDASAMSDDNTYATKNLTFPVFKYKMSSTAYKHVRFVAYLLASISEDIIFAYLGVFLFSSRYDWNVQLIIISILSCVISRIIMVVLVANIIWHFHILCRYCCKHNYNGHYHNDYEDWRENINHRNVDAVNDKREISKAIEELQSKPLQIVLVLSGLRGAVSFALAESMPIFDEDTGTGTYLKKEIKAMTSSAIIFTIFVFGGSAHYILKRLGVNQS